MDLSRRDMLQILAGGVSVAAGGKPEPSSSQDPDAQIDHPRAPNVLIIVLDDVGYSDLSVYGSEIRTPACAALAREGTCFRNFHVTSLCAPTRASLLTGHDAHAVGVGTIAEFGTDRPGYQGYIHKSVPTMAEIFRENGYQTLGIGKWHLSPILEVNESGPFDQWPTGRGFDRWYGFHGPIADHWHPELFEGTAPFYPDKSAGYHLSTDLTDKAISWINDATAEGTDRPFFAYLAFGACHWPLHVPRDVIDSYEGWYNNGWDPVREARWKQQVEGKIIPAGTRLPPWNENVPAWSSLNVDEQRFSARTMQAYAAFLEHTDQQIDRLLRHMSTRGLDDDTIVVLLSDNGASKEGGPLGMSDVRRNHYIAKETSDDLVRALPLIGSDRAYAAYANGWTQVSNTPFKYYKSKTFGGGVRAPLIIRGNKFGIETGARRDQFHHVSDLAPTLYELCQIKQDQGLKLSGAKAPSGISMVYCFADPDAPTRKIVQHFETHGDRAVWAEGWKAVASHEPGMALGRDQWSLYCTDEDFNELDDLADLYPKRLEALRSVWRREAESNDVLPLDDRTTENFANRVAPPKSRYIFSPRAMRLDRLSAPRIDLYDHVIQVSLVARNHSETGVILASGTALAGYELILVDGRPTYVYAFSRDEHYTAMSTRRVVPGENRIDLRFTLTGPLCGHARIMLNGDEVAETAIPQMWKLYATSAGVRCGHNPTAPISRLYEGDGTFSAQLSDVVVAIDLPV